MEVILLESFNKLGKIGDVVNLTYYAVTDSREFKIIGDGLNEQKENDPNDILTFKVKDLDSLSPPALAVTVKVWEVSVS